MTTDPPEDQRTSTSETVDHENSDAEAAVADGGEETGADAQEETGADAQEETGADAQEEAEVNTGEGPNADTGEASTTDSRELSVYRGELEAYAGDEPSESPEAEAEAETPEPLPEDTREVVLRQVREHFAEQSIDEAFAAAPTDEFIEQHWFDFSYLDEYLEVERYWVNEPFAYITLLYDEDEREYRYHVVEPTLDTFELYVRQDLVTLLRNSLLYLDPEEEVDNREQAFTRRAKETISEHAATVDDGTLHKLLYYLLRDFLHFGPIDPIMRDGVIEDVSCDGENVPVYVYHREYRDLPTNVTFSKRRLNSFVVRLAQQAGKSLTISDPLVDATLADGSRIQITLGPDISTRGSNFTIRKFAEIPYTPLDLIRWGTFSIEEMVYFWLAIEHNKSLIFAGGTGSGKTTSMNAVSFFIPPHAKIVSIEDTREIDLPHENWIQSVTRSSASGEGRGEVTTYDLLQSALRQRPEYLLVGEIRTEQRVALTFFQAMGTGHTAYTTVHADSVNTALSRLQNPPLSIPTQMLSDLDVISVQRQSYIGERRVRRNQTVAELRADPETSQEVDSNEVFSYNPKKDTQEWVGESRVLQQIADERGWSDAELATEFENRKRLLQYLLDEEITGYADVASTIHMYAKDPDYVLERLADGALAPAELPIDVEVPYDVSTAAPTGDVRDLVPVEDMQELDTVEDLADAFDDERPDVPTADLDDLDEDEDEDFWEEDLDDAAGEDE